MSDLFDRVAARALGLNTVLRPRARSRFEPGAEPLGLESSGIEFSESQLQETEAAGEGESLSAPVPSILENSAMGPTMSTPETAAPHSIAGPRRSVAPAPLQRDDAPTSSQDRITAAPLSKRSIDMRDVQHEYDIAPHGSHGHGEVTLISQDASETVQRQFEHMALPRDTPRGADVGAPASSQHELSRSAARTVPPSKGTEQAAPAHGGATEIELSVRSTPASSPLRSKIVTKTHREATAKRSASSSRVVASDSRTEGQFPARQRILTERDRGTAAERFASPSSPIALDSRAAGQLPQRRAASIPQGGQIERRSEIAAPPAIEVTIGRLEIRAEPLPAQRSAKPFQPRLDIAAYRARREGGQ